RLSAIVQAYFPAPSPLFSGFIGQNARQRAGACGIGFVSVDIFRLKPFQKKPSNLPRDCPCY
ncbi:MAG: hypothetical protein ACI9T7_001352, partial [Oleiphilaceae bacterium]